MAGYVIVAVCNAQMFLKLSWNSCLVGLVPRLPTVFSCDQPSLELENPVIKITELTGGFTQDNRQETRHKEKTDSLAFPY